MSDDETSPDDEIDLDDDMTPNDAVSDARDTVSALADCEGWRAEGYAARVHYQGAGDRYSVEFYAPSECVLYWKVHSDGDLAVPVGRETVPMPLRERVRQDLAAANLDPAVEAREL